MNLYETINTKLNEAVNDFNLNEVPTMILSDILPLIDKFNFSEITFTAVIKDNIPDDLLDDALNNCKNSLSQKGLSIDFNRSGNNLSLSVKQ